MCSASQLHVCFDTMLPFPASLVLLSASTDMRQKMGLSEEAAKKIIKGVQNQRMIGSLQAAKSAGQLTLSRLLDMRESGIDIESFVSEDMRLQMFSKEVRCPRHRVQQPSGSCCNCMCCSRVCP
jgi:hypothetical protein